MPTSQAPQFVDLDVTGETMPAFVARPAAAPVAGVIVIQEIFGVDEAMQRVASLLADRGYLAIIPALFHRTDAHFSAGHDEAGIARGRAAASALDFEQISADLTAAGDYLQSELGTGAKIGTWGFCFGGSVAFLSATLPFVDAAVSFYGAQIARSALPHRPPLLTMAPHLRAPLLLAFGGRDQSISSDDVGAIRAALEAHAKPFDLLVYPDEDHAFFRGGPDANDGARDVWPRVAAFFGANLGSQR